MSIDSLTVDSTFDEVAEAIIKETVRRGYSRAESVAVMSTGMQESNLRPTALSTQGQLTGKGSWYGIYQQNEGYPNRADPNQQVLEFLNRLDVKRRASGASPDIFLNIFWLQQAPSRSSADEAYRLGRQAYLTEIQRHIVKANQLYDRFAGGPVRPEFTELPMFGKGFGTRSRPPINWLLHTQEPRSNATAKNLAEYCQGQNGVSYHYTIRDRVVYDVVDTDRYSWSVLSANAFTINLCFAGSSIYMSRAEWLSSYGADIEIAAYLAVQDCQKYRIPLDVIAPPYGKARPGISDHRYVTNALGIGDHKDVWDNFPWDVFKGHVNKFAGVGVVNAVDEQYKQSPWLGKRLSGEKPTADGVGRFSEFEHGHIYWSPATGAWPIPEHLFESYAEVGWEAGGLGYPVAYHTVIPNGGDVQAFQRGVLYRKYGEPGHFITGMIGNRYRINDYQAGLLGWPVSDEIVNGGMVYQVFENGRIAWSPDGTIVINSSGEFV